MSRSGDYYERNHRKGRTRRPDSPAPPQSTAQASPPEATPSGWSTAKNGLPHPGPFDAWANRIRRRSADGSPAPAGIFRTDLGEAGVPHRSPRHTRRSAIAILQFHQQFVAFSASAEMVRARHGSDQSHGRSNPRKDIRKPEPRSNNEPCLNSDAATRTGTFLDLLDRRDDSIRSNNPFAYHHADEAANLLRSIHPQLPHDEQYQPAEPDDNDRHEDAPGTQDLSLLQF